MDAPVVIESVSVPHSSLDTNVQPSLISDFNNTENGNKGFPFDDSDYDNRRDRGSFHSHLDDLARRHPELAEHLNFDNKFKEFPFRANTWGHNRRSSLFSDDNSEPTSFRQPSRFGTPLGAAFEKEFEFPFTKDFKEEPAAFEKSEPKEAEKTEKPPQVPTTEVRSRKPNPNVPQSNTVDLGQKQEPVKDTREQRSMSAPPENRQQRFVSSINIPMQGENDSNAAQSQAQQPKQQQSTNERVIPIHVEGRDEPVIPKGANHSFSQPQPQPDRTFNQRPAGFGGTWNRGDAPYYTGEPPYHREDPHNFYNNSHRNEAFGNAQGPFKQQKPPAPPQSQNPPQQQTQPQPSQPQPQVPPQQQVPPPHPPTVKLGPIEQIQEIKKNVLELMNQVEKFNGKPKDKDCVYLDEMLTRNLLKLDDVDTEGKENIRNARKEAIKCIQKCISILEAKANANELLSNHLKDISNEPLSSLEVSGVSRPGTENSIQQEEPVASEEQPISTETENKDDIAMQTTQAEPVPLSDDAVSVQEQTEPIKSENNATTDVEMNSEANNVQVTTQTTEPSQGTNEQPMEVEEPKEKKDKKKVKKKVDKTDKH